MCRGLAWTVNFNDLQLRIDAFVLILLFWFEVIGAERRKCLLRVSWYFASRSMAKTEQKGRDEKGVACYTQAEQRQGRAFASPSICAYQHTNKGSTWDSSASPASCLWWSESCDVQLATWRHICGFPVVLTIKERQEPLGEIRWVEANWGLPIHPGVLAVPPMSLPCLCFDGHTDVYLPYDRKCSAFGPCVSNICPFEYQTFFGRRNDCRCRRPRNYQALVALFHALRLYDSALRAWDQRLGRFYARPTQGLVHHQSKQNCPPRSLNHSTHPSKPPSLLFWTSTFRPSVSWRIFVRSTRL